MPQDAHSALVNLGPALGYPFHKDGACFGVTVKWLESCLVEDESGEYKNQSQRFVERVERIRSVEDNKVLVAQINAARDKVKGHIELTDDDKALLEITAFYDVMNLYHKPFEHTAFFGQKINQNQIDEVSEFVASESIKKLGGLVTIHSEPGIYTKEELSAYLERLKTIIEENSQNASLLLTCDDHSIGLHYDLIRHSWTMMDINQWPPFKSEDSTLIATRILAGFIQDGSIFSAFNTKIITTVSQQKSRAIEQFSELRKQHLNFITQDVAQRKGGGNLLFSVAQHGHMDVVKVVIKLLLESSRVDNLSMRACEGGTPLYIAAQLGYLDIVNELVTALLASGRSADLSQAHSSGDTPLFIAAHGGYFGIVNALIKALLGSGRAADLSLVQTVDGATPLYMAASNGHLDIVNALIKALLENGRGDDISLKRTNDGTTPLFIAAQEGHINVVDALIKALLGRRAVADLSMTDTDGTTPLFMAATRGHLDVVNLLSKVLLENGRVADISLARMSDGATALLMAAMNGHINVVNALIKILVENGKVADLSLARTKDNTTPLFMAAQNGHLDVVNVLIKMLLEHGRVDDLNVAHASGTTALCIAAQNGHLNVVNVLIKTLLDNSRVAALNLARSEDGITPLFMATSNGYLGIVRALLDAGANPDLVALGMKPLQYAACCGYIEIVDALLQKMTDKPARIDMNLPALRKFVAERHSPAIARQIEESMFKSTDAATTISITPDEFLAIMGKTTVIEDSAAIKEPSLLVSASSSTFFATTADTTTMTTSFSPDAATA